MNKNLVKILIEEHKELADLMYQNNKIIEENCGMWVSITSDNLLVYGTNLRTTWTEHGLTEKVFIPDNVTDKTDDNSADELMEHKKLWKLWKEVYYG